MLLLVAGVITMVCLPLSVLGASDDRDALIYKVEIFLPPKEGRDETADIQQIKETVKHLNDIDVLFSFKELGNPRIILILDVEKACSWPQLTGFLSSQGFEFSVTSLYHCSDFAKELGLNLPNDMWVSSFGNDDLLMEKQIFPVKDLSTLEYIEKLKWTFEKDLAIIKNGQPAECFKTLAEFPVELVYFGPASQSKMEAEEDLLHGPNTFHNEVSRIEKLDDYTGVCQGD
ncbi:uncharacterized protein LOC125374818 [Haliotis rufescens]|uniref:uncharacterized protein LOC125374818 n=1 Tax=Haliotis rufescens TaxID=6454 RepID=UPI001EB06E92|nr:uncharacterized protein LOC125374818 [Haliotis rufescens]